MLSLVIAATLGNVVTLDATTESLEVQTLSAASTDFAVSWLDLSSGTPTPGSTHGNVASIMTTTIAAAPAASTQRAVTAVSLCNAGVTAQSVILKHDTSGTERILGRASLAPSECVRWDNNGAMQVSTSTGSPRVQADIPAFSGRSFEFSKSCTAYDTIGYHINCANGTGFPGAFTIGTPGVNGLARDCSTAAGALITGSHVLPNAVTGGWYLTRFGTNANVAGTYGLVDILWQNTGLAVASGPQAISTPTWPARDVNGGTAGEGVRIAIQVLSSLGNAATIATSTITYVNSNGDPGRTGFLSAAAGFQVPVGALISTWVPFTLQAGDTGVQSISSFNSGTTYTSGTFALAAYRPLALDGVPVANYPSGSLVTRSVLHPGVRLWNGTCFNVVGMGAIATTAPVLTSGIIEIMEQ
jgi:hypothetical protein